MSETPRTDAKASDWNEFNIYDGDAVVPASFARILERENAALREDKERLITILKDLVDVAKFAMFEANNDGAEWDIKSELSDARAAIDAARKEQP